ncbi:MAG: VWA domain-containing protein [Actinomycetota bacterium]|nr:VWA domain-containing protein [Actinomycetota bacterium]
MSRDEVVFPFNAVVGQEDLKLGLLLNAVSNEIGGILIRGKRGTAKSTLARGLSHLLPEIEVVTDCRFFCDPCDIESLCRYCEERLALEGALPVSRSKMKFVTLPLNATEDMVTGTLDIGKALREKEKTFEPGILAKANRGILYIDEVNLLEDHIVDLILDSAAMGTNIVEREGISFKHSSRFILVGTMNPEEGELRPQLEDRFGLCADADSETTAEERLEILRRNLDFKRSPIEFESRWNEQQELLRNKILEARSRYEKVHVSEEILKLIASVVEEAEVDGHRAELAILHSARALAALEGHGSVNPAHIERVAPLGVRHRLRKGPLELDKPEVERLKHFTREITERAASEECACESPVEAKESSRSDASTTVDEENTCSPEIRSGTEISLPENTPNCSLAGKTGRDKIQGSRGRYYRSASASVFQPRTASDIAKDATLRACATRVSLGGSAGIMEDDIRVKLKKKKAGASILFVVDASASMGAERRLEASRQAVLSLLKSAYESRDRVGLVVFKDDSARLVMSPTSSHALAKSLLNSLKPGGATPLSHGLSLAYQVLDRELSRKPSPLAFLVLVSDGGANVTLHGEHPLAEAIEIARKIGERGIRSLVIDSATATTTVSKTKDRQTAARRIAEAMGASYFPVKVITEEVILKQLSNIDRSKEQKAAQAVHPAGNRS